MMRRKIAQLPTFASLLMLVCEAALAGQPAYYPDPAGSWERIPPREVSIEKERFSDFLDFTFARGSFSQEPHKTNALLVLHDGRILYEEYRPGFEPPGGKQYIWSISKLLANAILGRAEKLEILDRNWRVEDHLAGFEDPLSDGLNLQHLMQMSSGLRYYEEHPDGIILSNSIYINYSWRGISNVAAYMAMQGAKHPAGRQFNYSSGDCNLAMALLHRAFDERGPVSGVDPQTAYNDFPWQEVFEKIGMTATTLEQDGSGTFIAGSFGWSTARDLARLSLLYQRNGWWDIDRNGEISDDEQLFPPGWVTFSSTLAPSLMDSDYLVQEDFLRLNIESYGAYWWLNQPFEQGGRQRPYANLPADALIAMGLRGQTIVILPGFSVIVVRLGSDPLEGKIDRHAFFGLLMESLVPGFERRESVNPRVTGYDYREVNQLSLSRVSQFLKESSDDEIVFDDPFSIMPAKDLCSCLFVMGKSEDFCLADSEQYQILRRIGLVSQPVFDHDRKAVTASSRLLPLLDHLPWLNRLFPSSHTATARHVNQKLGCMITRLTAPWRGPFGPLDLFGDYELRPSVDYFD